MSILKFVSNAEFGKKMLLGVDSTIQQAILHEENLIKKTFEGFIIEVYICK